MLIDDSKKEPEMPSVTNAGRMDDAPEFGALLRSMRVAHGWSLRDLGIRIRFNRGYIGKVEQGEKLPDRQFAELADAVLSGNSMLIRAWQADNERRRKAEKTGRLLLASTRDSLRLITTAEEEAELADLDQASRQMSVAYLSSPPVPMLQQTVTLRSEALRRLKVHQHRPHELSDLYLTIGRLQGILAYAALDLGDAKAAMTHADAAWVCADRAGDNELRVWVRGTQSLIARFQGEYQQAMQHVQDGLTYDTRGTGELRLLCGYAQCHANLGDGHGANEALNKALRRREHLSTRDSISGLFEFSEAKQHYYAGSSLIWLDGGPFAQRAATESAEAIALWERQPAESRSLDDEALAHVYQGTAFLQLGQLDAAAAAIRPILDLPAERQISWIRKRMTRFNGLLHREPFTGSREAADLYAEIEAFAA